MVTFVFSAAGKPQQWQTSVEWLDRLLGEQPDSPTAPEALYEKGWALQNLNNFDDALSTYEQVIATSNGEAAARAQFMIGEIQFEQGKHADAIKSFYAVIHGYGYPTWQADATYEAARCFEVRRQVPQALKLYETLVEKYPDSDKVPAAKKRIAALKG